MSWDERQRAMLAEMGFRLPAVTPTVAQAVIDADEPAPVVVVAPAPTVLRVAVAAAPSSFGSLDLTALAEAVSACRACGLGEQRRHAVFGGGAQRQAQWLVVTDPADEADDLAGEALVGNAGRLLDRMLLAAGQRRTGRTADEMATAFVTPIVKCRPPRGRPAQPAELDACEAVLARQVELLQPRLVLAMGLQAARRLTGLAERLGRLRGRVLHWRGLPLVVTYAPAYLLRSPADKAGAWDDLCLARKAAE
ncbi:MAG: uracil-DNA glycosylase [Roseateles sp.]|uniref:uracil-DNA glycosylase n=1 Tax=Roseateles sp. TaxID=1971397 RepID=UPI004034FF52